MVFMPHKRSIKARMFREIRRLAKIERQRVFYWAFYDRERAELVALKDCQFLDVKRGDVLLAPRYVHPALVE
ncbi:MAG: hypothetical protein N3E48_04740 [Candidatus Bathyarchaeota archaeon]|nr:hypothetical protein [Candidatus Bathyarchaeota archaeon]